MNVPIGSQNVSVKEDAAPTRKTESESTLSKDPVPFDEPETAVKTENAMDPIITAVLAEAELFSPPDLKDAAWSPSGEKDMPELLFPAEEPAATVKRVEETTPDEETKQPQEQPVAPTTENIEEDTVKNKTTAAEKNNQSEATSSTPKRVKKKRSWLSLSPGLRRLRQKEKSADKEETNPEPQVKGAREEAARVTATTSAIPEDLAESKTGVPVPDVAESAKEAKPVVDPASSTSAKKEIKEVTFELVTVAEGIDDIKAAERRNFSRAVSMDTDDDDDG